MTKKKITPQPLITDDATAEALDLLNESSAVIDKADEALKNLITLEHFYFHFIYSHRM